MPSVYTTPLDDVVRLVFASPCGSGVTHPRSHSQEMLVGKRRGGGLPLETIGESSSSPPPPSLHLRRSQLEKNSLYFRQFFQFVASSHSSSGGLLSAGPLDGQATTVTVRYEYPMALRCLLPALYNDDQQDFLQLLHHCRDVLAAHFPPPLDVDASSRRHRSRRSRRGGGGSEQWTTAAGALPTPRQQTLPPSSEGGHPAATPNGTSPHPAAMTLLALFCCSKTLRLSWNAEMSARTLAPRFLLPDIVLPALSVCYFFLQQPPQDGVSPICAGLTYLSRHCFAYLREHPEMKNCASDDVWCGLCNAHPELKEASWLTEITASSRERRVSQQRREECRRRGAEWTWMDELEEEEARLFGEYGIAVKMPSDRKSPRTSRDAPFLRRSHFIIERGRNEPHRTLREALDTLTPPKREARGVNCSRSPAPPSPGARSPHVAHNAGIDLLKTPSKQRLGSVASMGIAALTICKEPETVVEEEAAQYLKEEEHRIGSAAQGVSRDCKKRSDQRRTASPPMDPPLDCRVSPILVTAPSGVLRTMSSNLEGGKSKEMRFLYATANAMFDDHSSAPTYDCTAAPSHSEDAGKVRDNVVLAMTRDAKTEEEEKTPREGCSSIRGEAADLLNVPPASLRVCTIAVQAAEVANSSEEEELVSAAAASASSSADMVDEDCRSLEGSSSSPSAIEARTIVVPTAARVCVEQRPYKREESTLRQSTALVTCDGVSAERVREETRRRRQRVEELRRAVEAQSEGHQRRLEEVYYEHLEDTRQVTDASERKAAAYTEACRTADQLTAAVEERLRQVAAEGEAHAREEWANRQCVEAAAAADMELGQLIQRLESGPFCQTSILREVLEDFVTEQDMMALELEEEMEEVLKHHGKGGDVL